MIQESSELFQLRIIMVESKEHYDSKLPTLSYILADLFQGKGQEQLIEWTKNIYYLYSLSIHYF